MPPAKRPPATRNRNQARAATRRQPPIPSLTDAAVDADAEAEVDESSPLRASSPLPHEEESGGDNDSSRDREENRDSGNSSVVLSPSRVRREMKEATKARTRRRRAALSSQHAAFISSTTSQIDALVHKWQEHSTAKHLATKQRLKELYERKLGIEREILRRTERLEAAWRSAEREVAVVVEGRREELEQDEGVEMGGDAGAGEGEGEEGGGGNGFGGVGKVD